MEQPHNNIQLAVGEFITPELDEDGSVKVDKDGNYKYFGLLEGANGDMGANEVASFDQIFFLHHFNIDGMFWVWQKTLGKQILLIYTRNMVIHQRQAQKVKAPHQIKYLNSN